MKEGKKGKETQKTTSLFAGSVKILHSAGSGQENKIVVVISNKIEKKAVKRNKLRRQIKEFVRGKTGVIGEVVVIVKNKDIKKIREDITELFNKK